MDYRFLDSWIILESWIIDSRFLDSWTILDYRFLDYRFLDYRLIDDRFAVMYYNLDNMWAFPGGGAELEGPEMVMQALKCKNHGKGVWDTLSFFAPACMFSIVFPHTGVEMSLFIFSTFFLDCIGFRARSPLPYRLEIFSFFYLFVFLIRARNVFYTILIARVPPSPLDRIRHYRPYFS